MYYYLLTACDNMGVFPLMFEVYKSRDEINSALQGASGLPSQQGASSDQQGFSGQTNTSNLPLYQSTHELVQDQLYYTSWSRNNNCKGCLYYVIMSELEPIEMHSNTAVMKQITQETPRYRGASNF